MSAQKPHQIWYNCNLQNWILKLKWSQLAEHMYTYVEAVLSVVCILFNGITLITIKQGIYWQICIVYEMTCSCGPLFVSMTGARWKICTDQLKSE